MRAKLKAIEQFLKSSPQGLVISLELILGFVFCLSSLIFFVYLASEVLEKEFAAFDLAMVQYIYTLRTPWLTNVMILVSDLGENVTLIAGAILGLALVLKKHRHEFVIFALTLGMGLAINLALKNTVQRPRPELAPLVVETSFSFPSGHAMNSFLFYSLIAYFSYHFWHSKKITIIFGLGAAWIILLIGFSRVYLGVHFPTDVLAGYIAGFWWLVTILLIEKTFTFYHLFKERPRQVD